MPIIFKSANLKVSAAAAWEVVERYMRNDVHVFSTAERQRMEGPWRIVTSAGVEYRELNLTIDPEHMFASYTVPDVFDSTFHHASMRVFDRGMVVVGLSGSQMSILMSTWSIKPTCMTCCGPTLSRLWRPARKRLGPRLPPTEFSGGWLNAPPTCLRPVPGTM